MTINFTEYFDIFRSLAENQQTLDVARATTIPAAVDASIGEIKALSDTVDHQAITDPLRAGIRGWQNNQVFAVANQLIAQQTLVQVVNDDIQLPNLTVRDALIELITQMEDNSQTVEACVPAVSVTPGGGNVADIVLAATIYGADGQKLQNSIPDTIFGTMQNETILLQGTPAQPDLLAYNWPQGNGVATNITPDPSSGLLVNGGMDAYTQQDDVPDGWTSPVGTPGTTLVASVYQEYDIIIAGTPASGVMRLVVTTNDSTVQITVPIAVGATAATVQAALRALTGLESVTVTATGTTPDFTYHVIMVNLYPPNNLSAFSYQNNFNTGTITINQTQAGTSQVFYNRSLEFDSNGTQNTMIQQEVLLDPETVYVFNGYFLVDVYPAAGVMTVDLVDGDGSPLVGGNSYANIINIDPQNGGDLPVGAWTPITGFFITPAVLPSVVYLRIYISTDISTGSSVFVDQCNLSLATQLYSGGPYVAAILGRGPTAATDTWEIATTNNFAGLLQSYNTRIMQQTDLLLPSLTAGWTIPDGSLS